MPQNSCIYSDRLIIFCGKQLFMLRWKTGLQFTICLFDSILKRSVFSGRLKFKQTCCILKNVDKTSCWSLAHHFFKKISQALLSDRFTSVEAAESMPDERFLSHITSPVLPQTSLQLSVDPGNNCNHDTGNFHIDTLQTVFPLNFSILFSFWTNMFYCICPTVLGFYG